MALVDDIKILSDKLFNYDNYIEPLINARLDGINNSLTEHNIVDIDDFAFEIRLPLRFFTPEIVEQFRTRLIKEHKKRKKNFVADLKLKIADLQEPIINPAPKE